jgi:hypothetical protein
MAVDDEARKALEEKLKEVQERALKAAEQAKKAEEIAKKAVVAIDLAKAAVATVKILRENNRKRKAEGKKVKLPPGLGGIILSVVKQIILNLNLQEKAIQRIIEELQDRCPSEEKLQELITFKNKVKNALTEINTTLDSANQVGVTLNIVLGVLQTLVTVIRNLPLPTSVPPGVGIPLNVINKITDIINITDKSIDQGKAIVDGLSGALGTVQGIIQSLIENLDLLDQAIAFCASKLAAEQATTPEEAQEIIAGFLNNIKSLNETPESDNSNPNTLKEDIQLPVEYNGFSINIENAPLTDVLQNIPRRRAVATSITNSGVVIIGDYSFSSSVQVLIDTMKFAINNYSG